MTRQEELVDYLLDGKSHDLKPTLAVWMVQSARFTEFADRYRDKIRKKIRVIQEPGVVGDLQRELLTAYLLLKEPHFDVTYEAYASAKKRGPDFSVVYRTNQLFNVEVTRIRSDRRRIEDGSDQNDTIIPEHLVELLLDKFGQLQPGMANVLMIYNDNASGRLPDLGEAMQRLKLQAEHKDPALFNRDGLHAPTDFFKYHQRLSAILLFQSEVSGELWINKQARPVLGDKIALALGRLKMEE